MGRFLSPDPSVVDFADPTNPQSLNLYSYARNNPLNSVDPSGMECVWDDGSYDASDDPDTGSADKCSGQGGTWVDPSIFEGVEGNQAGSWSGKGSSQIKFDWLTLSATVNAGPWDFSTAQAYLSLWVAGQLPTQLNYVPAPGREPAIRSPKPPASVRGIKRLCPSLPSQAGAEPRAKRSIRRAERQLSHPRTHPKTSPQNLVKPLTHLTNSFSATSICR